MTDEQLLGRIVLDARVMVGKPVIKGTRLTVEFILGLLARGATVEDILEEHPGLKQKISKLAFFLPTKLWKSRPSGPSWVKRASAFPGR